MSMTASLADWRARAQSFSGPHGDIAYWTAGPEDAPVLLLIHGFPTASWDWARIWDRLGARWRLVALDMLGFGFSAKPANQTYRLVYQADLQELLAARLKISRAHILAHDYGVSVAQELLARQADGRDALTVESVVYLNGGLIPGSHRPRLLQRLLASPIGPIIARSLTKQRFAKAFSEVFAPATQPDEAEIEDFWSLLSHNGGHRLGHRLIRYMAERESNRERWVGALAANIVPQRYICGALDPVSGAHLAETYRATVPEADVALLEDIGHYPQWEAPDAMLAAFDAFHDRLAQV